MAETTLIFWGGDAAPDAHTLTVAGFIGEQVMLDVTVAEVNRTKLEQHGIDFRQIAEKFASAYFMGGGLGPAVPGFATTTPPIPPVPELPLSLGADRPNFVFRLPNQNITALIQFLQSNGLATIIAQPTILALSGQEALFQVGGEIPIRIVTGFVADVEFKPFGTIVQFLPRVSEEGDILLTVTPEVSQADFNSPVDGIPTFRTRRASTSAKLRDGETLVLGGLTQTTRRGDHPGAALPPGYSAHRVRLSRHPIRGRGDRAGRHRDAAHGAADPGRPDDRAADRPWAPHRGGYPYEARPGGGHPAARPSAPVGRKPCSDSPPTVEAPNALENAVPPSWRWGSP